MDILIVCLVIINILLCLVLIFSKNKTDDTRDLTQINEKLSRIEGVVSGVSKNISDEFRDNRKEISDNLEKIQNSNEKKLEEMRETVDEKLQASVERRFNQSFSAISKQLSDVYKGLGEMKNLANGVGDLKKVMEGVKTRGIYGEVQLGAIIEDVLAPEQYIVNAKIKRSSLDRVEFAVKMPGKNDENVLLPIDSKFPIENYSRLIAAYDSGEKTEIIKYQKALAEDVKTQAKKIFTKYVEPPITTDFGMMFVPTESLYAEILRIPGLSDEIRQKYNITISSPSTLPVILSGLLMGFRTIAIEKRSSEVWKLLGAIKTQFSKFGNLLENVENKLKTSTDTIEKAKNTSRQIEKKLSDVEMLPEPEAVKMIGEIEE